MADDKGNNVTIKINEADLLALLGDNGERWVKGVWSGAAYCRMDDMEGYNDD